MRCAWRELLSLIPQDLRGEVDRLGKDTLQELRLRIGKPAELITAQGVCYLPGRVTEADIRFTVNVASRYSPWATETAAKGYITAPGGHRIGVCGNVTVDRGTVTGMQSITSLNIRVARDIDNVGDRLMPRGNTLILGPPGSGKTTLLRSLARIVAQRETVAVVDERSELFPDHFEQGRRMDVLTGCAKGQGIDMVLRSMGPQWIAVDEITAQEDCDALKKALWCGVKLMATAHASTAEDLHRRSVYKPLAEWGIFDTLVVMRPDKTWYTERMMVCS